MSTSGVADALTRIAPALAAAQQGSPEAVKACCAAVYGLDLVALFLGESYHPGGERLTRRLAEIVGVRPGERVVDVASGIGTTALLLAEAFGASVTGVDLGTSQVTLARARAAAAGLADRVAFELADAEALPFAPGSFGVAICECALCTFPGKAAALREMRRVLTASGRLGIADVWVDRARLDPELQGLAGRVACLADARPVDELVAMVGEAGFDIDAVEHHDEALGATVEQVRDRLRALRLLDLPFLRALDLRRAIAIAGRAADAVGQGHAGYVLVAARAR